MKNKSKIFKYNNIEIEHKKIDTGQLDKIVEKALKFYKSTMLTEPDKIFLGKFYFPKIMWNDKIIDIEKEFEGGKIIATVIGAIPFIVYFSNKGGEFNAYFHEFEPYQVLLCVDPEDTKRIFLAFTKDIEFDVTGIK